MIITRIAVLMLYILPLFALPLIITLIYKYFYTNHANRILNGEHSKNGKPLKRWISPISLFVIICCAEVLLAMILVVMGNMSASSAHQSDDVYELEDVCQTYSQADIEDTIYKSFDGSDVEGYASEQKTDGDFSYVLYTNEKNNLLPAYVLRVEYTGNLDFQCWDQNVLVGDESTGTMDHSSAERPFVSYAVLASQVNTNSNLDSGDISYTLNLYTGDMDDYDTGELGTYDMPDPADSLTVNIR